MENPIQTASNRRSTESERRDRVPFRRGAVIGAGVMGSQIAAHLANAGLQVLLLDSAPEKGSPNSIVEAAFKKTQKMKPAPFVDSRAARRLSLGNFEDDFSRIEEADWILEAVVERLDVKHQVMERIERHARPDAVISTNTSGLPIHRIAQGRSEAFRRRFLGTHFFNPPRYLRLFEVIATTDTDPRIIERVSWFARVHLGKGVVPAKDTPNFIGNRVGVYAMNRCLRALSEEGYTIEEVDLLTGPLTGHPKSATFRTADVVGLDTMIQVSDNLYEAVPEDECREEFQVPDLARSLVASGALGAKSGRGFYKKVGGQILSVNPRTLDYEPGAPLNLGDIDSIAKIPRLEDRLRALFKDSGRAGEFFRRTTLDTLGYSARRLPEIADSPAAVDRAIRWGFGWELGPFQTWDALGFREVGQALEESEKGIPAWLGEMLDRGAESFYRRNGRSLEVYLPAKGYQPDPQPEDEIDLNILRREGSRTVWENPDAALLDLGQGVLLYEFRSKANTLGRLVMEGLLEVLRIVEEGDYAGLVIGNQGRNFSVGANLGELAMLGQKGDFDAITQAVVQFQETIQRLRYCGKPVVTALHSQVLGGACEVSMGSAQTVAASETYMGLVELGAGLIPAGTGTTHLAARAAEAAVEELPSLVQPFLLRAFQTVGSAKVATSGQEAIELGYLLPTARIAMNAERRLHLAREEVLRLFNQGYAPPPVRESIYVLGQPGRATLELAARGFAQAGYATEYDCYLAGRLAYVLTGGNLSGASRVHEDYLLELEREVFLSLLGEEKTRQRIEHILTRNKPLRN